MPLENYCYMQNLVLHSALLPAQLKSVVVVRNALNFMKWLNWCVIANLIQMEDKQKVCELFHDSIVEFRYATLCEKTLNYFWPAFLTKITLWHCTLHISKIFRRNDMLNFDRSAVHFDSITCDRQQSPNDEAQMMKANDINLFSS